MDRMNKNDEDIQPLSPEEIKAIGEIELGPSKHEEFLNKHYKKLLWGGIVLGVVGGSVIAFFTHREDMRVAAGAELVTAMQLQNPQAKGVEQKAIDTIEADYSNTPSALTAKLLQGLALLQSEKPEEGVSFLQQNLLSVSENVLLNSRAYAALATYYQSVGQEEKAKEAWLELGRLPSNPYAALALMSLGDMAKEGGDKEAARAYYEQAVSQCATSALVTDNVLKMRLLLLDVDAPKKEAPLPETPAKADSSAPKSMFDTEDLKAPF